MKPGKIAKYGYPAGLALLLLVLWTAITSHHRPYLWIFPSPAEIGQVFVTHPDLLFQHAIVTIWETLAGLCISIFLGSLIAVCMDNCKAVHYLLYPFVIVSQTVPIIALAPLFIIWFGYGVSAKIFIVSLVCFFPIAVNLYDGFQQVSVDHLRLFKSMRASTWQVFRYLKLPCALPAFFTGLKLSVSYSVMAAIIGEWLGGEKGLGIYMTRATKSYQTAHVFAIIIIICTVSLILYGWVVWLEKRLLKWRYTRLDEYVDTAGIKGS
jgi:ABC-type nitrate/sulfonate/bicarbonate transport system permease component